MSFNKNQIYVFASSRKWHLEEFKKRQYSLPGKWVLIKNKEELIFEKLIKLNPRYIFFPHWSDFVDEKITDRFNCICFHETEVPYGRGGSPIQNLIIKGKENTKITALKMTSKIDSGPIYLQKDFSLIGLAEEIYIRSSKVMLGMIKEIIVNDPNPKEQFGESIYFKRRNPEESFIGEDIENIEALFNFIRMLDADGYPRAKLKTKNFTLEFSRPALRTSCIEASVKIKNLKNN
tara:strand:- start:419 stop:1120 length:702 start_codon:yes stop_codon:yes gene_type:complete